MRQFILGFGRTISGIGLVIAGVCLILEVFINGANVVARHAGPYIARYIVPYVPPYVAPYISLQPLSWAEDAMVYLMITGVFWGAAAVAWRQIDIRIDAFANLASGRTGVMIRTLATLISIFVLCTLFQASLRATWQLYGYGQRNDALSMPVWIVHAIFGTGVLIIILMTIARMIVPENDSAHTPTSDGQDTA